VGVVNESFAKVFKRDHTFFSDILSVFLRLVVNVFNRAFEELQDNNDDKLRNSKFDASKDSYMDTTINSRKR
jgi:hypothetical protein